MRFDLNFGRRVLMAVALGVGLSMSQAAISQAHETAKGPKSVADLAERLVGAVVNISTSQIIDGGQGIPLPKVPEGSPFQEYFNDYFEKRKKDDKKRSQKEQSLGSGFVIDSSGLIVTNNHVIADADEITVKLWDGTLLEAKIVGRDTKTDIALLKVDAGKTLPTVSFGSSESIRVGDWVMAVGNPFGLGGSVSVGIVSARNRDINSGPYDNFIQTDAAINRGNSGGPLFDMHGNVVGINTAIISPTGGSIGLGFAIPSEISQHVVKQLVEYGETRRGWLGIRIQEVTSELAEGLGLDEVQGALVAWVNEYGPAHAAGLRPGDVISKYDGRVVKDIRDLTRMVADTEIGRTVAVEIIRKGKAETLTVTIGHLEANEQIAKKQESKPKKAAATILGMELSELTRAERKKHGLSDTVEGVVVEAVADGSIADKKNILPGMVIVEIDQEIVSTPTDVAVRLASLKKLGKKTILFLLARPDGGELIFVPIKVAS